ncbi:MAG: hypothetical protein RBR39_11635 [Proteiniphilum sp.]|nr:hypothetical protein [Proteiniphilum sp.]
MRILALHIMINVVQVNTNKYPYLSKKEGSNDIWVFLDENITINVTAVCGAGKELSADKFVEKYKILCQMAFNNEAYNKEFKKKVTKG